MRCGNIPVAPITNAMPEEVFRKDLRSMEEIEFFDVFFIIEL
jgi:hypothetical protein